MKISGKAAERQCYVRTSFTEITRTLSISFTRPKGHTTPSDLVTMIVELFPGEIQLQARTMGSCGKIIFPGSGLFQGETITSLGHSSTFFRFVRKLTLLMALSSCKCQLFWSLSRKKDFDSRILFIILPREEICMSLSKGTQSAHHAFS